MTLPPAGLYLSLPVAELHIKEGVRALSDGLNLIKSSLYVAPYGLGFTLKHVERLLRTATKGGGNRGHKSAECQGIELLQ